MFHYNFSSEEPVLMGPLESREQSMIRGWGVPWARHASSGESEARTSRDTQPERSPDSIPYAGQPSLQPAT